MRKQMTTLEHYTVEAEPESGEWNGEPEYVGKVDFEEWCQREDTEEFHYDTYVFFGEGLGEMGDDLYPDGETRAITVKWVTE